MTTEPITRRPFAEATPMKVPEGATPELDTGGGGYGPPAERDPDAVLADVPEGYITEQYARNDYPHAFTDEDTERASAKETA